MNCAAARFQPQSPAGTGEDAGGDNAPHCPSPSASYFPDCASFEAKLIAEQPKRPRIILSYAMQVFFLLLAVMGSWVAIRSVHTGHLDRAIGNGFLVALLLVGIKLWSEIRQNVRKERP